jgi:RING finger protein 113A
MFRKPKKNVQQVARRRASENSDTEQDAAAEKEDSGSNCDDEDEPDNTSELLLEARRNSNKRFKKSAAEPSSRSVLHTFDTSSSNQPSEKELATSTASHHAAAVNNTTDTATTNTPGFGPDGIYRNTTRNLFHAGPIRAAQHVRVTTRFDYQPDVCKDYKQTGFCGYGDSCIYLHDRGDTLTGWQLEQVWEQEQVQKRKQQEADMDQFLKEQEKRAGTNNNGVAGTAPTSREDDDDGLPFACYLCRSHFKEPVVTNCGHYFCQDCILQHVRQESSSDVLSSSSSSACPICHKDTFCVFNEPIKLMAKKRKVLRASKTNSKGKGDDKESWKEYYNVYQVEGA